MLGLADSFMNASRFRADREDAARQAELEQQRFAMEQSRFALDQEAQRLRLDEARRLAAAQKRLSESLHGGALPGQMMQPPSYSGVPPAQAAMLENNAPMEGMVAPPPVAAPAQGMPTNNRAAYREFLAAKGDVDGLMKFDEMDRKEAADAKRRAAMQAVMSLGPEDVLTRFRAAYGEGSGVTINWDPKAKNFRIDSNRPGQPSSTLSLAEMRKGLFALAEKADGDLDRGLEMYAQMGSEMRNAEDKAFNRSGKIADMQKDLYYQDRGDQRDAERLGIARTAAKRAEERATAEEWKPLAMDQNTGTITLYNERTGATMERPMPKGPAGVALMQRLFTPPSQLSLKDEIGFLQQLMQNDPDLTVDGARQRLRDMIAERGGGPQMSDAQRIAQALLQSQRQAAPAAQALPGPAPRPAPTPGTAALPGLMGDEQLFP